jgi:hypothetical protein
MYSFLIFGCPAEVEKGNEIQMIKYHLMSSECLLVRLHKYVGNAVNIRWILMLLYNEYKKITFL